MYEDVSGRPLTIGDDVFIILSNDQYHDLVVFSTKTFKSKQSSIFTIKGFNDIEDSSLPKICDGVVLGFNDNQVLAKIDIKDKQKVASVLQDIVMQLPACFIAKITMTDSMEDVMESLENDIENWNMQREATLLSSMLN